MNKENVVIVEMMKDFLYYGYTFKFFISRDYSICKNKTIEELQELWQRARSIMARDVWWLDFKNGE